MMMPADKNFKTKNIFFKNITFFSVIPLLCMMMISCLSANTTSVQKNAAASSTTPFVEKKDLEIREEKELSFMEGRAVKLELLHKGKTVQNPEWKTSDKNIIDVIKIVMDGKYQYALALCNGAGKVTISAVYGTAEIKKTINVEPLQNEQLSELSIELSDQQFLKNTRYPINAFHKNENVTHFTKWITVNPDTASFGIPAEVAAGFLFCTKEGSACIIAENYGTRVFKIIDIKNTAKSLHIEKEEDRKLTRGSSFTLKAYYNDDEITEKVQWNYTYGREKGEKKYIVRPDEKQKDHMTCENAGVSYITAIYNNENAFLKITVGE